MKINILLFFLVLISPSLIIAEDSKKNWLYQSMVVFERDNINSTREIKRIQNELAKMKASGAPIHARQTKIKYYQAKIIYNDLIIASNNKEIIKKNAEQILLKSISKKYYEISPLDPIKQKNKSDELKKKVDFLNIQLLNLQKT